MVCMLWVCLPLTIHLCYWGKVPGWHEFPLINIDLPSPVLQTTPGIHQLSHLPDTVISVRLTIFQKHVSTSNLRWKNWSLGFKWHHHSCEAGRGQSCEFCFHSLELHLIKSVVWREGGKTQGGRCRKSIFCAVEWGQGAGTWDHSLSPFLSWPQEEVMSWNIYYQTAFWE